MRAFLIAMVLAASSAAAYYGQPLVRHNNDAVMMIVTVTTVFAGFLIAIVAVLGDPSMIPDGTWRSAELRRDAVENRLIVHLWLFVIYLITIAFLFVSVLLQKATGIDEEWHVWIERLCLFFFTASFLFTLALPRALWKLQLARFDAEIDRRRQNVGLKE